MNLSDVSYSGLSRRGFLGGGALMMGAALTGCHTSAGAPSALRVAIVGKGEADPELLFHAAGIKPDFPVSYSHFESGHLVVEALNSGAVDYGSMSEIPPVFAAASAVQSFRQIAVQHGDVNNQVVLVPKGSPITGLAGLKGKRVGYVRATTAQYFLIRMLQSVGLGWQDIQPVAMSVSDGAAAFARGSLDAWAIYGFPIEQALATEGARILRTALGFLSGNYIVSVHRDALADPVRVDWIGRWLRLTRKGYAWAAANSDSWANIIASKVGVSQYYIQSEFQRRSADYQLRPVTPEAIKSQQQVADVFTAAGLVPGHVNVSSLWDSRFNSIITSGN